MSTKLNFSTTFDPKIDGQLEMAIQVLEDLLRSCLLYWQGSWDDYLLLVEFAYNNSFQSAINTTPFDVLYGRPSRFPTCLLDNKDHRN